MPSDKNLVNKLLQYAVTVYVAALFFSPALSVAAELFIYCVFFSRAGYIKALCIFITTPVGKAFSYFLITTILGVLVGSVREWVDWSIFWSMRKILILPIVAVIFQNDEDGKEWFLKSVFLVAVLIASYGLISLHVAELPRGGRALIAYNGMLYAVAVCAGALHLCRQSNALESAIVFCCVVVLSLALMSVGGRSAYIATIVIMGYLVLVVIWVKELSLQFGKSVTLLSMVLVLVGGMMLIHPTAQNRIQQALVEFKQPLEEGAGTSVGLRKVFYVDSYEMLKRYSLIGAGTASYESAHLHHLELKGKDVSLVTRDPHNSYLKIWIEQGLIGLFALLWLLISLARKTLSSITSLMGGVVLLGWGISSLFNGHLGSFTEGRFFWAWTGVLLASIPSAHQPSFSDAKS
jgi:O-antigen ligase